MKFTAIWLGVFLLALIVCASPGSATAQRDLDGSPNDTYAPGIQLAGFDCGEQCATFRAACVKFCENEGYVPGSEVGSDDCKDDCKEQEAECLETCIRGTTLH